MMEEERSKASLVGFAHRGPVGLIVGGVTGLAGGIFGKSKLKKAIEPKQVAAARLAWDGAYPISSAACKFPKRCKKTGLSNLAK